MPLKTNQKKFPIVTELRVVKTDHFLQKNTNGSERRRKVDHMIFFALISYLKGRGPTRGQGIQTFRINPEVTEGHNKRRKGLDCSFVRSSVSLNSKDKISTEIKIKKVESKRCSIPRIIKKKKKKHQNTNLNQRKQVIDQWLQKHTGWQLCSGLL